MEILEIRLLAYFVVYMMYIFIGVVNCDFGNTLMYFYVGEICTFCYFSYWRRLMIFVTDS